MNASESNHFTDEDADAAKEAYWAAYSAAVRDAPSNRNGQGITAEDARAATRAGYRAAFATVVAGKNAEIDRLTGECNKFAVEAARLKVELAAEATS